MCNILLNCINSNKTSIASLYTYINVVLTVYVFHVEFEINQCDFRVGTLNKKKSCCTREHGILISLSIRMNMRSRYFVNLNEVTKYRFMQNYSFAFGFLINVISF